MIDAFGKTAEDSRRYGKAALVRFAFAEQTGLLMGAAAGWIAKLTTDRSVMWPAGVSRESWFQGA